MNRGRILIVDDELILRESLARWLERDGHELDTAANGEEALKKIKDKQFDILLADIKMPGMSGIDVLKRVKESDPEISVVMITAYGSISTAIEAMKNGAYDYLLKPFEPDELGLLIEKILRDRSQQLESLYMRDLKEDTDRTRFEQMLGQSSSMQEIFSLIQDISKSTSSVIIMGETGTGKGLAAKAIHSNSPYCDGPFVVVNCGAIPEHLMESELFGHQKGAFTDAISTKKGRLELAHNGTLFLDEIGEISMRMQIDLLKVLEDHLFYRVGGTQPIEANFRVIAATNKNIEHAIKAGQFREDLFYRLNVISFTMPALRDRKEDIPILADFFLRRFSQDTNKPIDSLTRETLDEMMLYEWPGNVRELENAIERSVVVAKGRKIVPEDLPIFRTNIEMPSKNTLREVEKAHIVNILRENEWNISKCAKILEIDRSTLYNKMKRYNILKPI